jgi:hypothetical protein
MKFHIPEYECDIPHHIFLGYMCRISNRVISGGMPVKNLDSNSLYKLPDGVGIELSS